jgi:hypothetical protein
MILRLLLLLLLASRAQAHSLSLSVLSLRQHSDAEFLLSWEQLQPGVDPQAAFLLLRPQFPEGCRLDGVRLHCERGLRGRMAFAGLGELSATVTARVQWREGPPSSFTFSSVQPQHRVQPPSSRTKPWFEDALSFLALGLRHIWGGWDHLLFVLGLLALSPGPAALLKTITAFTVAHSITLAMAVLGLGALPSAPVEACIALSIMLVAAEALQSPTWTGRAPWLVALIFGLLHGFGFAGALSELELPRAELPMALLCFNVGVELGQLSFVAVVLTVGALVRRIDSEPARRLVPLAHYASGAVAAYWLLERTLAIVYPS